MNDDVRAAAERLRKNRYNDNSIYEGIDHTKERDIDRKILADAYLALHPADDDEPVTEDWVIESGLSDIDLVDEMKRFLDSGERTEGKVRPCFTTRGQVRRLLAAMGVGR